MNRLTVTLPKPRDGKVRAPAIPPSVLERRARLKAEGGAGSAGDGLDGDSSDEDLGPGAGAGAPGGTSLSMCRVEPSPFSTLRPHVFC